jgi:hypothetical protein
MESPTGHEHLCYEPCYSSGGCCFSEFERGDVLGFGCAGALPLSFCDGSVRSDIFPLDRKFSEVETRLYKMGNTWWLTILMRYARNIDLYILLSFAIPTFANISHSDTVLGRRGANDQILFEIFLSLRWRPGSTVAEKGQAHSSAGHRVRFDAQLDKVFRSLSLDTRRSRLTVTTWMIGFNDVSWQLPLIQQNDAISVHGMNRQRVGSLHVLCFMKCDDITSSTASRIEATRRGN